MTSDVILMKSERASLLTLLKSGEPRYILKKVRH